MPDAKLAVEVPEGAWIHDVSVDHPDAEFRVVAVLSAEDTGIATLELRTPDPVPVIAAIEGRDDVADAELLWSREAVAMVQVETTSPLLLRPVLAAGIPLRTPFDVVDGTATWEVTTSTDRLSTLGTRLEAAGVAYDIEHVREAPADPGDAILTDRQREVLVAAAEAGYYDTPRGATLTSVAESLGISKATGSDVLHRAEGAVVQWFIDEHLAGAEPPGV